MPKEYIEIKIVYKGQKLLKRIHIEENDTPERLMTYVDALSKRAQVTIEKWTGYGKKN